jgi:hypothetical protein
MVARAEKFLYALLKNGTDPDMNVDGSSTPVVYKYTAPHSIEVTRMNILVMDVGMGHNEFGGLGALLTNGLEIKAFNSSNVLLKDFTDGQNIKSNDDWALLAGVDVQLADSAQNDLQPIRWTFEKAGAKLLLESGDYIQIKVQDNLTDLTKFQAMVQGQIT